jgi:hypothetical protein
VFWWSKYSHYGISNLEAHQPLHNLLLQLCDNDVKGPVLSSISMPANVEVSYIADVSNPIIGSNQSTAAVLPLLQLLSGAMQLCSA